MDLIDYVESSRDRLLVLMLHSMEVIPGASPYATSERDVQRIVNSLRALFEHCIAHKIRCCTLTEAVTHA